MIDETDLAILQWLQEDSRMQWKEIGEKVHLTGQAVAARIRKMEDLGVIEGFTVKLNSSKLGLPILALITVFMNSAEHSPFQQFINSREIIKEAYRISGEGCYWLKVNVSSHEELNRFLDELLKYGNYRVNISIGKVK